MDTLLTDVFKQKIQEKLLRDIAKFNGFTSEFASKMGIKPNYLSMIKNPDLWTKVPALAWESAQKYVNSGLGIEEYGKKNGAVMKEAMEIVKEVKEHKQESEITDPVFEEEEEVKTGTQLQNDFFALKSEAIHEFIKTNASKVITKYGEEYYFMPYWFLESRTGQFQLYSLGNLLDDLREAIKSLREV
jgi:hypothetical protein